ncbi:MAG: F390 synthetase-related protein, partial [Saprospiraceae bacterium]
MEISKWLIFYYFLKLRFSRYFRSNKVSGWMVKQWEKNLEYSIFYQKHLSTEANFPKMNKQIFMENFNTINTVGVEKSAAFELALQSEVTRDFSPVINGVSIGLSSGTSGNRGIFLTSKKEKAIWVAAILDRVIGLSFKKRKVAFFLRANNNLYESVKSGLLSFSFFDLKNSIIDHFQKLQKDQADILVAQPSVLYELARIYERGNIPPTFSKVISVAEVLEADQQKYFQRIFNCEIVQVYQCTEGFLAYTCKKGKLHFNEDWLKIEKQYLDDSYTRFHPVITDYLRSSQPVIRYELNDIIHQGLPCTCGSKAMVIDRIEGRSDDVFRFDKNGKEILIYPDFIRRAVLRAS